MRETHKFFSSFLHSRHSFANDYSLYFEMNALSVLLSNLTKIYCSFASFRPSPPKNVKVLFRSNPLYSRTTKERNFRKGVNVERMKLIHNCLGEQRTQRGIERGFEKISDRNEVVFWFSCHLMGAFLDSKHLLDTEYGLRSYLWWIFLY